MNTNFLLTDLRFQKKKRCIGLQHLRRPIGPVINETKSRHIQVTTNSGIRQNFTINFTLLQCSGHHNSMILSAGTVNHRLLLIWTSMGLPYESTTQKLSMKLHGRSYPSKHIASTEKKFWTNKRCRDFQWERLSYLQMIMKAKMRQLNNFSN